MIDGNCATIKELSHELNLHRDVDFHDNVIRFYGITAINKDPNDETLACAVSCLHDEGIMHRDLHSGNGLRESTVPGTSFDYYNLYTECWNMKIRL
ncbi:unnamed protein product [Rhizophagus irregularis]|nr:unnamed protein product [Rhizophagus irregularis]